MSILKQLFGVVLVLVLVGGGYFAYEQLDESRAEVAGVQQSPEAVPVRLAGIEAGQTSRRIEAVGSTMANRAIEIVPLASGRIAEILFRAGERVDEGEPLIRLDDEIEQANLAEAEAALTEARLALERGRALQESRTVAQAALEELIATEARARAALARAERQLADRTIRAPFAGIMGLRRIDLGARVDDTTVISTLDDITEIEIEFSLPETLYSEVRLGQRVVARAAAFPDREFRGEIANIDSRVDPVARAFKVRARLPNRDLSLPAGMFMLLTISLDERETAMVPENAVVAEGDTSYVYVAVDGRALRRTVELGQRDAEAVEILSGLEVGERVVVAGTHRLRDGALIREVEASTAGPDTGQEAAEPGRV